LKQLGFCWEFYFKKSISGFFWDFWKREVRNLEINFFVNAICLHIWCQISFLQHDVRRYPSRNWRENHKKILWRKKVGISGFFRESRDILGAYLGFLQNYSWQRWP
jgi:hypothetical protein